MTAIHRVFGQSTALLALAIAQCGSSLAQTPGRTDQTPSADRTIDQQLLEGLNAPPQRPAPPQPVAGGSGGPRQLLKQVLGDMRAAERRLAERDTSPATQATQRQIVEGIARLLEQVGESAPGGAPTATGRGDQREVPVQPAEGNPEPGTSSGPPGSLRDAAEESALPQHDINRWLNQMWGHLPPRVRNQLQAPRSEHFLPKYERTIEQYYLRLAEEPEPAP